MRAPIAGLVLVLAAAAPATAVRIDLAPQDVERALTIARSRDSERTLFHAHYIQDLDQPFVERAELVSEFRRVVLLAEQHAAKGDRQFGYSSTRAGDALKVWRRRISVIARVRFHPQNNYLDAPPVEMKVEGNDRALIGVLRDAVRALPPGRQGEFVPVLGAVVEGVFEAEALGQGVREFVISLEGRELARVTFNLADYE